MLWCLRGESAATAAAEAAAARRDEPGAVQRRGRTDTLVYTIRSKRLANTLHASCVSSLVLHRLPTFVRFLLATPIPALAVQHWLAGLVASSFTTHYL